MKHYGGENEERGQSVQQTDDGGYIITGYTYSYGAGSFDVWLLKTDQYGNKIWDRTFGGKSADFGNSVQQTTDGGFIITGSLSWNRYLYLIKTDRNGNLIWEKAFEGYAEAEGKSVQQTADGGYIITGYTNSFDGDNSDLWLIKTDGDGNKIWDRMFGGASFEYGTSVLQTSDGEYVVTGFTKSYGAGNNDIWLIKTDSDGNEIWDKTFGGADEDRCYCFQQTNDDGFILAGITYSSVSPDVWLIKTDASGNKLWDIIFGGNCADFGFSVQQTADGGYIIVGLTESFGEYFCDVWLIKTDSDGNKIWDRTFHGLSMEYGESVQQTADGGFILTGGTFSYGNGYDLWLIKTDDQGRSKTKIKNHFSFQGLFTSKLARFFIVI
jgi:hypothetical protein